MYAAMLNKKLVLAVDEACLVNARQKKLNRDNYHHIAIKK
jgi:competence protein CoiA